MNKHIDRIKRVVVHIVVFLLKLFSLYPSGEGIVSLRARIDGNPKNIYVARGARIRRDAWLICKSENARIYIGENTSISSYVKIHAQNGFIKIGENCSLHSFSVIYGGGGVLIGDKVRIATNTVIVSGNHNFGDITKDIYEQGATYKKIIIKDDVWIGAHVTVLAGVTIGSHSVIAAGSVVTKDVPDNVIVAGVPATIIRSRLNK